MDGGGAVLRIRHQPTWKSADHSCGPQARIIRQRSAEAGSARRRAGATNRRSGSTPDRFRRCRTWDRAANPTRPAPGRRSDASRAGALEPQAVGAGKARCLISRPRTTFPDGTARSIESRSAGASRQLDDRRRPARHQPAETGPSSTTSPARRVVPAADWRPAPFGKVLANVTLTRAPCGLTSAASFICDSIVARAPTFSSS